MGKTAQRDSEQSRAIAGPREGEPRPVWKHAPRHVPQATFPAYRHVPGVTPHPERDEKGHSFGLTVSKLGPLSPENWRKHRAYLWGIDLYHQGYFWESHESWEGPWRQAEPDSLEANLLQALILNSAAQLKVHLGNAAGARTHSVAARWRLARIRAKGYDGEGARFLGLDIGELIEQMKAHYGLLWEPEESGVSRVRGPAPRLRLAVDAD